MRVVAGKYRGKKLNEFEFNTTKPTLDRVKEAIFSSIQFECINATVLDLFSGTGALGIEAISRGAKKTFLVDKEKNAINLIKANTKNITEDFEILNQDYESFLSTHLELKFDIVLLDPPFATDLGEDAIDFLIRNNMLTKKGIIVFEKSIDKNFCKEYDNYKISVKKYGKVEVVFLKREV